MNQNFDDIGTVDLTVLDPDAPHEEISFIDNRPDWGSDETVFELDVDGLSQKEARKMLIKAMNLRIQKKNAAKLKAYREKVQAWKEFVLDEENDGKRCLPFPTSPNLLKTFNARQLNQAVFMARQTGSYGILLEKAGFRAKK